MFKQSIASGFKDTTRVAQSNPQWGVDICRGNTAAIREGLVAAKQDIERLLALLDEGESSELFAQFRRAQSIQESLRSEDL